MASGTAENTVEEEAVRGRACARRDMLCVSGSPVEEDGRYVLQVVGERMIVIVAMYRLMPGA